MVGDGRLGGAFLSAVFWTAVLLDCLVGPEMPSSIASTAAGKLAAPLSSVEGTVLSKKTFARYKRGPLGHSVS